MRLKFSNGKLEENVTYNGIVTVVELDENNGRVRVHVRLDAFPEEDFYKSLKYSNLLYGEAAQFFEELGLIDSKGTVNTEDLEGERVIVTLNQSSKNYNWYVKELWFEEDSDEELPEDDEEDEFQVEDDEEDEFQVEDDGDEEEYSSRKKSSTRTTRR